MRDKMHLIELWRNAKITKPDDQKKRAKQHRQCNDYKIMFVMIMNGQMTSIQFIL